MERLDGRVCLVTGASSGIGTETARGLARLGARVLVVGRDRARTEAVAESLAAEGGAGEAFVADFSSLASVRALADAVSTQHDVLHVLVHNAGLIHLHERVESRDAIEDTFAVNHLAPFLLTQRLLPLLKRAAPARVVTVSSRLHTRPERFDFEDWAWRRRRYRGLAVYAESKLANVMFSNALARRLEGTGVTSNSLHPGDVATQVVRENRFLQWGLDHIARFFLKSAEEGAATSIYCAASEAVSGVTGRYFDESREARMSAVAQDEGGCERLWGLSEELVARHLGG